MNYLYAILCGTIVSLMSIFNGQLSAITGSYLSTVIIHLSGLMTVIMFMLATRQSIKFNKETPKFAYLGGVIGVSTTLFQVIAVGSIGTAAMTALSLLGQMCTSIFLEQYGLLGVTKQELTLAKFVGLVIVALLIFLPAG